MTRLLRRLRYLLERNRYERELDDELQFHLEMKRQDLESCGLDRAAAALAARRALGNLPLTRDHVRDVWILTRLGRRPTLGAGFDPRAADDARRGGLRVDRLYWRHLNFALVAGRKPFPATLASCDSGPASASPR